MLLKHLLNGRRKSDFIVVKDNVRFDGFSIVKKFIEENLTRSARIHLLLTEKIKCDIRESENVVVHKFFLDPWNLLEGRETELSFEQIIECILSEKSIHRTTDILFVIDSLSYLLQFVSLHLLSSSLKKLMSYPRREDHPGIQILSLLHSDDLLQESKEHKNLLFLATTVITVSSERDKMPELKLKLRQSNGKITEELYTCGFGPKKELQYEIKKNAQDEKIEDSNEKVVTSTFKLTLEEKEKESRSKVVLPYTNKIPTGKGRIYYEPDVNDDWDDEDPDDDLEI